MGLGEGLTAPFQIAFLGQSLFLFSPVCGQSHSEASGPKVSWSIIPILHCKQTGCLLPRCVPDTEISSLSAVHKKICVWKWLTLIVESVLRSPAVCMAPVTLCVLENLTAPCKSCEFFRAELNWAEQDAVWWRCVPLSYSNRCLHPEHPGCLMGCFKGHCYSVIRGSPPELQHTVPVSKMQDLGC